MMGRLLYVAHGDRRVGHEQTEGQFQGLGIGSDDASGALEIARRADQIARRRTQRRPPEGGFVVVVQAGVAEVGGGLAVTTHEEVAGTAQGPEFGLA